MGCHSRSRGLVQHSFQLQALQQKHLQSHEIRKGRWKKPPCSSSQDRNRSSADLLRQGKAMWIVEPPKAAVFGARRRPLGRLTRLALAGLEEAEMMAAWNCARTPSGRTGTSFQSQRDTGRRRQALKVRPGLPARGCCESSSEFLATPRCWIPGTHVPQRGVLLSSCGFACCHLYFLGALPLMCEKVCLWCASMGIGLHPKSFG